MVNKLCDPLNPSDAMVLCADAENAQKSSPNGSSFEKSRVKLIIENVVPHLAWRCSAVNALQISHNEWD